MWCSTCISALAGLFFITAAAAQQLTHPPAGHPDPYHGLANPYTKLPCCNGIDCQPVTMEQVEFDSDTGLIWVTEEDGVRRSFPMDQVQASFDHRMHYCRWKEHPTGWDAEQRRRYTDPIRCFLVPGSAFLKINIEVASLMR